MLNLVICEDNVKFSIQLEKMVSALDNADRFHITSLNSISELRTYISDCGHPDILLMDIHFDDADGVNAVLELFSSNPRTQVIYITGYIENCTRVYETRHVYFLVKPVNEADLKKALSAAVENLNKLRATALNIKVGSMVFRVPISEILYIESDRRKLLIHTANKVYDTYGKLADLVSANEESFIRCHQSYAVNAAHIATFGSSVFELTDGTKISISRHYTQKAKDQFMHWLQHKL